MIYIKHFWLLVIQVIQGKYMKKMTKCIIMLFNSYLTPIVQEKSDQNMNQWKKNEKRSNP